MPRTVAGPFTSAFAATERQLVELYQVTLVTSDVYYFTGWDLDVPSRAATGGVTWTAVPVIRGPARFGADLRVDDMELTLANFVLSVLQDNTWAQVVNSGFTWTTTQPFTWAQLATTLVSSSPLAQVAMRGQLDGAEVKIYLVDMSAQDNGLYAHSTWKIQGAAADRTSVVVKLESPLGALNALTPRRTWQEQCNWPLYSSWCTASRAAYTVYGKTVTNNTSGILTAAGHLEFTVSSVGASVPATIPGSWFELGQVIFTTGTLNGLRRSVQTQSLSFASSSGTVGAFDLLSELPFVPSSGDQFTVVPGCNKTVDHCQNKFNNFINFGGFRDIPKPETAIGF